MWRCPTCKSKDHLEVVIETWARLIQPDDDPDNFETDTDEAECGHDHEWGAESSMICVNPECADMNAPQIAEYFETDEGHIILASGAIVRSPEEIDQEMREEEV